MSRIRGRDTGPELELRQALRRRGLRYRKHAKLPGKPDIAFQRQKIAVFVDGCFWHRCPAHATKPISNSEFWRDKLDRNMSRDAQVNRQLTELGWTVLRIWEHEVNENLVGVVARIEHALAT